MIPKSSSYNSLKTILLSKTSNEFVLGTRIRTSAIVSFLIQENPVESKENRSHIHFDNLMISYLRVIVIARYLIYCKFNTTYYSFSQIKPDFYYFKAKSRKIGTSNRTHQKTLVQAVPCRAKVHTLNNLCRLHLALIEIKELALYRKIIIIGMKPGCLDRTVFVLWCDSAKVCAL